MLYLRDQAPRHVGAALLLTVSLLCPAHAQQQPTAPDTMDMAFNDDAAYPVVITPTRLRQSLADVPASITIITAETMRRHGITRVEDALRLVPGMHVNRSTGNDYEINYHGTRRVSPRRLNVLIDGVSAYQHSLSQMDWSLLPVVMEDIDRIEVIRGPDSASYGPNSMMAVVNILTKHPKDVERVMVAISGDDHHTLDATARIAASIGDTSLRITAHKHRDIGYDRITPAFGDDDTSRQQLTLRAEHLFGDGSSLQLTSTFMDARLSRPSPNNFLIGQITNDSGVTVNGSLFSARWTKALNAHHETQIVASRDDGKAQQNARLCTLPIILWKESAALFDHNPALAVHVAQLLLFMREDEPVGLSPTDQALLDAFRTRYNSNIPAAYDLVCGTNDHLARESRSQIEIQHTYAPSDVLRFVGGLGWRGQSGTSQTFLNGTVSNNVSWLFGHIEYRPTSRITANLGGYGERNSLSGNSSAPRAAINLQAAPGHTLRAVVSKGMRTPDLFEEKADWRYTLTDLSRPIDDGSSTADAFFRAKAKGGLRSEKNWSRELGYLMQNKRRGLSLDVRLFDEKLSSLISSTLTPYAFEANNNGSVRLTGIETQAQWDIASRWSAWLQYGNLLNRSPSHPDERTQYSRHSGALGLSWSMTDAWRASLAHYSSSGDGIHDSGYARTDLTVLHDASYGGSLAQYSIRLSQLHTPSSRGYLDVDHYFTSSFDRRLTIQAGVRLAF